MSEPSLPQELWRYILTLSVHLPCFFESEWAHAPDFALWNGWSGTTAGTRASLDTKLALVRVCREWRYITSELIYRYVFIPQDKGEDWYHRVIGQLADTLENSSTTAKEIRGVNAHAMGYGWWTKRLDIPIGMLAEPYLPGVLRILSSIHNLQILRLTPCGPVHPDGLIQLSALCSERFSHSLRRISYLAKGHMHPQFLSTFDHLPSIPLTAMSLTVWQPRPGSTPATPNSPSIHNLANLRITDSPPTVLVAFATITSLCLKLSSDIELLPATWHFPSLRHLGLSGLLDSDIEGVEPFIRLNGAHVTSLFTRYAARLGTLLQHTPRLNSLVLRLSVETLHRRGFRLLFARSDVRLEPLSDPDRPSKSTVNLDHLTHLGVTSPTGAYLNIEKCHGAMEELFSAQWKGWYPALRALRMMNEVILPVDQEDEVYWREMIVLCKANRIRLEDRHCGLVFV